MLEQIKLGLRLCLFAAIAAIALAATNEITKEPIALQADGQANTARAIVLPGVETFEQIPIEHANNYPQIQSIHRALVDDELEGYAFLLQTAGYKGPIVMTLAINRSGAINALFVNSQTETAGLGNKITEDEFLSQFAGLAADADKLRGGIDAVSGATISTAAVLDGVVAALRYATVVLGVEPKAGDVITAESVNANHAIEESTGTTHIRELDAFGLVGYPSIRAIYDADYQGQPGYLFEFDGQMIVLSRDGALLAPKDAEGSEDIASARGYLDQFMRKAVGGK